jgi:metallo-beta-lactamase family protein
VDAAIIESTYGDRLHRTRTDTIEDLHDITREAVERRGVVLIPAFAIGRTQEILFHFNTMVESGRLPQLPVIVDSPMGNRVTTLYRAYEDCYDGPTRAQVLSGDLPLEFPKLGAAMSSAQSKAIAGMRPPYVVIAGSGMCNGGRILHHLKRHLPQTATTVAIVGFQAEGTLGRRLVDGAESVIIDDSPVPVRARIATLGGFSAHADQAGLLAWARAVPGNPKWFVNHGEPKASAALAGALSGDSSIRAQAVRQGQIEVIEHAVRLRTGPE